MDLSTPRISLRSQTYFRSSVLSSRKVGEKRRPEIPLILCYAPLSNKPPPPPPFQKRKVNKPSLPSILILPKQVTWTDQLWFIRLKVHTVLVFGRMTSNFMFFSFSTLRSSSLWRIVTIFLLLEKAVYRPGTTSPSSRNLAPVGENSKQQLHEIKIYTAGMIIP